MTDFLQRPNTIIPFNIAEWAQNDIIIFGKKNARSNEWYGSLDMNYSNINFIH